MGGGRFTCGACWPAPDRPSSERLIEKGFGRRSLAGMSHTTFLYGLSMVFLGLVACDGDPGPPGEWDGTVRDSAGVEVVVNPATGTWTSTTAWRLEEELRIGAAQGDSLREFGRVVSIAVGGSGRIHVLDRHAQHIRVFDAAGRYVRTIGRGGGGPGELAGPSTVLIGPGDTILVPDMANQRVQRFLPDGSEAGTFRIPLTDGIPLGWRIREDGSLLEELRTLPDGPGGAGDERILLRVRAINGGVGETLFEAPVGEAMIVRDGEPQMTVFAPEPRWTALVDGRIVTGWNGEYRLELRNFSGKVERVVSKPFERRPFGESHRRALRELFRQQFEGQPPSPATEQMLQSLRYADHYPAYAELFGGPDGSLWVRHAREIPSLNRDDMANFDVRGIGAPEYDVFDDAGRFLGTVSTHPRFEPMFTHNDRIYGVERDELGVQNVLRFRIVR